MRHGDRIDRRSALAGVGAGAVMMLVLMFCVGLLVVRFCPGGENCEETGRKLYVLGLIVSLAVAATFGLAVRDFVDRRRKRIG